MKALNSVQASEFIKSKGITMSKSKLYKLTSSKSLIHHHAGNRLLFYLEELEQWCQNQITTPTDQISESRLRIIESAQKQIFKK